MSNNHRKPNPEQVNTGEPTVDLSIEALRCALEKERRDRISYSVKRGLAERRNRSEATIVDNHAHESTRDLLETSDPIVDLIRQGLMRALEQERRDTMSNSIKRGLAERRKRLATNPDGSNPTGQPPQDPTA